MQDRICQKRTGSRDHTQQKAVLTHVEEEVHAN